ncbi:elongation factor 1-beta [Candidatus Pacearchaeota archaeon]|nr:elongation factor 1-beta [Candidatus Pacearchaeota archaeon]
MSLAAVKIRIMPDAPDADFGEIEANAKSIITDKGGKVASIEQEPIAFGLKAVIITLSIDENFEQDPLLNAIRKISQVSSAEVIDFRRIGF